jgi:hypothetical protein
MIEEAVWKVDRSKFMLALLRILIDCGLLPMVVFTVLTSLDIEVIENTFFAVFLVFGILRIIRLLLDPPKYQRLRTSDLREKT